MGDARAAVLRFVEEFRGPMQGLADDADLFGVLGIEGDEAGDFMDAFFERFAVDATDYRWYFHHGEEGWSIGGLFYKPIHRRVGRIRVTLAVLIEAVRTQRWPIAYPEHVAPGRRWDIAINQVFAVAMLAGLAAWGWMAFAG